MAYQQTLSVGTVLIEEFRILGLLGSGGFANTYLALDLTLGREVAIKEYFPSDLAVRAGSEHVHVKSKAQEAQFEWALRRFVREAKTLAKFRHPSVVRVFRVFNANDTAYIVLEFVRGSNMETWLKALGRLPSQEELDTLLPPLLDALEVVHSAGILHRDIKPANIYIRAADKTPVLLDFGAARYASAGELAGTTAAIVSKGYSPHEAYATDSRLQGPWTDIYGLAATLYRSLTGAAPPESTTRVLEDNCLPAVSLEGLVGAYRPEFLAAIDFGLRIMPRDRPQAIADWRPMLVPDSSSMPRLLDANGDPTTVQEWRPISDIASDAPTAERGWSGSGSGGSGGRGMPSGRPVMPTSGSGRGRSGVVVGQHRSGPQPSGAPASGGAGTYATGAGGTTHLMQPSGQPAGPSPRSDSGRGGSSPIVSRTSEPLGNRTFLFGLAFLLVGALALGAQWLWPRHVSPPPIETTENRGNRQTEQDAAREQREAEQRAAEARAAQEAREKAEAERQQAEADKRERLAAEEAARKKAEEERAAAEARAAQAAREKAEAERKERERLAAEEAARQKAIDDKRRRELAEAEKRAAEEAARKKAEEERIAAEKARQQAIEDKRRRELAEAAKRAEEEKTREEAAKRERELAEAASAKNKDAGADIGATSTNDLDGRRVAMITEPRVKYLKDMQAALKKTNCYTGELTGDVEATRVALATFESGYSGERKDINLVSASPGEFERWLAWFNSLQGVSCGAPLPARAPYHVDEDRTPSALERYRRYQPQRPSKPRPAVREASPPKQQRSRAARSQTSYRPSKPAPRPSYRSSSPSYRSSGGGVSARDMLRGER